jgi:phosphatidate phosphatase PAH1
MRRKVLVALVGVLAGCSASNGGDTGSAEQHQTASDCPVTDPGVIRTLASLPDVAAHCEDVAPPDLGPRRASHHWHHIESAAIALAEPNHRGRDAFYAPDEPQWVLGKFTYGPLDAKLLGEEIDIYLQRDCGDSWESLGTTTTTTSGEHDTVEGVPDTGGRVYFPIPDDVRLGIGRHRVRMVVAGDLTTADQYIEVLPKGTPLFVTDVDGTLTERDEDDPQFVCDEESDVAALARGILGATSEPAAHDGAADLFTHIVSLGYRPLYLTARPEILEHHTHRFLKESNRNDGRGDFPEGLVHTTLGEFGASGNNAQAFKTAELALVRSKGFVPTFGFGDAMSDKGAYNAAGVQYGFYFDKQPTLLRHSCNDVADLPIAPPDTLQQGDWRIEAYTDLRTPFGTLDASCR